MIREGQVKLRGFQIWRCFEEGNNQCNRIYHFAKLKVSGNYYPSQIIYIPVSIYPNSPISAS